MKIKNNNAFTLVELAIVIVIIGLLVGGALAGKELIEQAKVRAQIKQFEEYDVAVAGFKAKYNFLPGDIPANIAARFNLSSNGTGAPIAPNGDGLIGDNNGNVPPVYMWPEPKYFFTQMWEAKFIKETLQAVGASNTVGETYPFDRMGKKSGIAALSLADGGLYYFMGITISTTDNSINALSATPAITPEMAWNLDNKIDDSIPGTGIIRAVVTSASYATNLINDTNANNCIGTDNKTYNLQNTNLACKIVVKNKSS